MRNSSNMVLLIFFGSTLPDRVHIGSINLRVSALIVDLFSASHATGTVTAKPRVRKLPDVVIALHSTHIQRSIEMVQLIVSIAVCSQGTFQAMQDILQLANTQFINLGSARRELLYRQKDGTGATSYAALAARSSAELAGPKTTTSATSRSVGAGGPVYLANRFALLSNDSVESTVKK
ncbi:hypothetical protein E2C01_071944 [Portunus trituberculatus]|uniref:Uncharacterized protein n=1 Tax=Portunus trituberculatus TaxID=210409 RepID=A0A5B7I6G4_PORTR|nr:hypothetical protein [Portunus trituberculatus]